MTEIKSPYLPQRGFPHWLGKLLVATGFLLVFSWLALRYSSYGEGTFVGKVVRIEGNPRVVGVVLSYKEGVSIRLKSIEEPNEPVYQFSLQEPHRFTVVTESLWIYELQQERRKKEARLAERRRQKESQAEYEREQMEENERQRGRQFLCEVNRQRELEQVGLVEEKRRLEVKDHPEKRTEFWQPRAAIDAQDSLRNLEAGCEVLARMADEVDMDWYYFKTSCFSSPQAAKLNNRNWLPPRSRFGEESREWFFLYYDLGLFRLIFDNDRCNGVYSHMGFIALSIRTKMSDLLAECRRWKAKPDEVRTTCRRARLAWDGWDYGMGE